MSKEVTDGISARSVSVRGEAIPLSRLLEENFLTGSVTEIQLTLGETGFGQKELAQLMNKAFGSNILPVQINIKDGGFNDRDVSLAEEFRFKLLPHLARFKLNRGSSVDRIESYAGPALVPTTHPLAHINESAAVISTGQVNALSRKPNFIMLFGFDRETPAHYLRLTVVDEPLVLSEICRALGNNNINIKGVKQVKAGAFHAEVTFILSPCLTVQFQNAQDTIRKLNIFPQINTVLPIIK